MKEESTRLIKETLKKWSERKVYTYQQKNVSFGKSPVVEGEIIFRFTNTLQGFLCKGKEIPIFLSSKTFHTTTLSSTPISENVTSDQYRLERFLKEFDEQFDTLISDKFTECGDVIFSTDPLFF